MKKVFTKLGIILIASATILPLSACTFNFYVNRVTNSIAKSFADQTSALIKSMVMSKELTADTSSTNDDIMGKIKNSSINNLTKNTSLDNWGDLQTRWGENGKIDVNNFNPDNFFKASGTGELTKTINSKKQVNDIFSSLDYIRTISIMANPQLENIVVGAGMDPISSFLKSLQGDLSTLPAGLQLIANLINNYGPNFLSSLTRIFGNLVNGSWSDQQTSTPTDEETIIKFMNNWKDDSSQPYSAWNDNGKWKIDPHASIGPLPWKLYPGHKVSDWKWKQDYDLYHGGTLINYLFWKMSEDNKIFGKDGKSIRYLGDIIADYINISGSVTDPKVDFDDKGFFSDIERYLPYLLTNPLYILTIIEAIIPVIKKWILDMPDITEGVKNLTIGNGYPSKPSAGSYNLLDIINTIKSLINQPEKLKQILLNIFGKTTAETRGFDTFLYDLKLNTKFDAIPLALDLGGVIGDGKYDPTPLITTLLEKINTDSVKNIIDSITDLITKISEQYPSNEGINIDLQDLENFLFNNTTGLLIIFKNDTIVTLKNIINKSDVTATDVEELYKSLGGHINKDDPEYPTFTQGSILDILQKTMIEPHSQLNNILNLLLGTTDESHKLGIKNIITANNNQWIKDNYEVYFDADNTTDINKKIGNTSNITMTKTTINNIETINLKYDFTYKIKNTTYHFIITAIDIENLIDFQGIRTFKFKSITLVK
ncbi:hypothetical protein [Spiroplasma endosymbiont of Danaus chrysippus]|uniref:hypothetical protein n=1 Tax=Spiroplasma endosymbiont of Danaus chrysippus TaxID=2691041 RepID=UPI0013CB5124|nr:hypothetical protein [Spiroplasma endosymbiont of Danaus chrysippus]CAB1054177.1 hypothetical protein [Spiroplasma endosymbiont of Danaus chrysippus]